MARLQEDVRRLRFWRSIIAELLGTLFVVFIGCAAFSVSYHEHSLAVKVGLAFGLTYGAMLYCVRNVGDAHLNPAVTLAMLVTRRSSVIRCLLFIAAQLIGAIIGAALVVGVTASPLRTAYGTHNWTAGCTVPANDVTGSQAFGVEFLGTLLLVFVVFACYERTKADEKSQAPPFIIGLVYATTIMALEPYTGGSVNTARSFGPALVNCVWKDHWVFWFGPLLGGVCGGVLFDAIFSTKSSFSRIRNCFTVFHPSEDEPGTSVETGTKHDKDQGDVEDMGVRRTDGTAPADELEVLSESKEEPTSEQKPRLKLFRPKFTCCGGQQATKDDVGASGEDTTTAGDKEAISEQRQ